MNAINAVTSNPAVGKEVISLIEVFFWLLEKILGGVISYGVREVLDWLRKRR